MYHWNSFSGRIFIMVMLSIMVISLTVSTVVLKMSQSIFMDTYGKSQEKVFDQIEEELNGLHENVQQIVEAIDSSWAFRIYLSGEEKLNNVQTFQNMYQMKKDLELHTASEMDLLNILVLSMHGQHYLSRTETISMQEEDMFSSEAVQVAVKQPGKLHYTFSHGGYSITNKNTDVVIVSQALSYQTSQEIYAVVLITLTMEDLQKYFDYFVTDNTAFYMVDKKNQVICSNKKQMIGACLEESWYQQALGREETQFTVNEKGKYLTVMQRKLPYQEKRILGVVDNRLALSQLYNMPFLVTLCILIAFLILAVSLWFAEQTIQPLSTLVQKMSGIKSGNFSEYMKEEGTIEVQELARTYNYMLDDIQKYIAELMETEKARRKSEIQALQMQINPHFIYNTLASIKLLVYQNDVEKTVSTIDAFIHLLRNSIHNTDEFVSIGQEIENLKNYVQIIHARYGEAVQVEFYISRSCYEYGIPKLILQPFVENAFFHGFPFGREGTIQIFVEKREEQLEIRILDDGVGMEFEKQQEAVRGPARKEYFSGIGIHNVQERLRLLYGEEQRIQIQSFRQIGTSIFIWLPARKEEKL